MSTSCLVSANKLEKVLNREVAPGVDPAYFTRILCYRGDARRMRAHAFEAEGMPLINGKNYHRPFPTFFGSSKFHQDGWPTSNIRTDFPQREFLGDSEEVWEFVEDAEEPGALGGRAHPTLASTRPELAFLARTIIVHRELVPETRDSDAHETVPLKDGDGGLCAEGG